VSISSEFLFAVCQLGAETALKEEVAAAHPTLRFAYSRPGLVTWRSPIAVGPEHPLGAIFARASGISLGPARDVAAIGAALPETARLHVFERDVARPGEEPPGFVPGARADALGAALHAASPTRFHDGARARPGELVLDVVVAPTDEEPPWLGAHRHAGDRSPWPGGHWPIEVPPTAPSRAYRKLEEALAWSRAPLRAGDVAVEIGSAPGGASFALLRRGLEVVGVDPGEMAPVVLGFEGKDGNRFRHLPVAVGALRREALPGRVHWLLLDVNLAPQVALHNMRRLVATLRRDLLGVLFTLKLNDWSMAREVPALVARVAAMGLGAVRATQLPSNRQEVFVYGETPAAEERRRRRR
jgi:23S rRNA (cytidine2498-2'-O)-methyltransferase